MHNILNKVMSFGYGYNCFSTIFNQAMFDVCLVACGMIG